MRFIVHELTDITISYLRAARKSTFYVMDSAYQLPRRRDSLRTPAPSSHRPEFERKYGS